MSRRPGVHEADVAALQQRLQNLLSTRGAASEDEIARYEADRERLLDLIGDQFREQRDYDASRRRLRAQIERDDSDGWFAGGYDAAHQAPLEALAHVDDDIDPRAGAESELSGVEAMVNAPHHSNGATTDLASVERRIGDVHGALRVEDAAATRSGSPEIGRRVLDDEAGDSR